MESRYAIDMRGVKKSFDGAVALKQVDLQIEEGVCHGLIGENGAGKTTLMRILGGIIYKDEGTVCVHGKEVFIRNKHMSESLGIAFIPQELDFVGGFTVAENVSQQKMMIIAKILSKDASIIIMDEPTARLGHDESEHLLQYIQRLKQLGKTIIFISHHLDEVMAVCDRVTVLRDGATIMTENIQNVTADQLVQKMVDREIQEVFREETGHNISDVLLKVENLKRKKDSPDLSFQVRSGEIIGFFGLVGAGRTEMIRSMLKIDPCAKADITLQGKKLNIRRYRDAIEEGIVLVPEERRTQGVLLNLSIASNIAIGQLERFTKFLFINRKKENKTVEHSAKEMKIRCHSYDQKVKTLSGGNQQKVVLAKHVESDVRVFILDEPTRGIDIGAKDQIYHVIENLAEKGMAVIIISSEIPELQRLCDAVYVMHEGKITRRFERKELRNANEILQYALAD